MKKSSGEIWLSFRKGSAFAAGLLLVLGIGTTLAVNVDSLNSFSAGDLISASQVNANFSRLQYAIENANEVPVGTIAAWHRDVKGPGDPLTVPQGWMECDGSPITDPDSPLVGFNLPDLNNQFQANSNYSKGAFLRGHTESGQFELDRFQGHTHAQDAHKHDMGAILIAKHTIRNNGASGSPTEPNNFTTRSTGDATINLKQPIAYSNGTPRTGNSTRPANFSVVWIMKIK